MYDLPPARTGKKGRPRIRGERITLQDFSLKEVREKEMFVGTRKVITNLFGKCQVTAIVTQTKSGSKRLFLCTASAAQIVFGTTFLLFELVFLEKQCTSSIFFS